MKLFFEVIDGEQKGKRVQVRKGLVIGRKKAHLTIRDPKVSGRHAEVKLGPDGRLLLVDLGSQNGIKVSGSKESQVALAMGVSFVLGNTTIQVIALEEEEAAKTVAGPKTWRELVRNLMAKAAKRSEKATREIAAIHPPLKLRFTQGLQTGTEWIVGYGPRTVGSASVDLPIDGTDLPGVCFRLIPEKDRVVFKNESDARLNGQWIKAEALKKGDVIDLKGVRIEVDFL